MNGNENANVAHSRDRTLATDRSGNRRSNHEADMTLEAEQFKEVWDSPCQRSTEAELNRLEDALDELTNATKHRDGAHSVRANNHRLKAALVKLHDLYVETMQVNGVAA